MLTTTRTYKITGDKETLDRFEGLLNLLHWAAAFGHTGKFGMPLDGDGCASFEREDPGDRQAANDILGAGYDVELAFDDSFSGFFMNRNRKNKWSYPRDVYLRHRRQATSSPPSGQSESPATQPDATKEPIRSLLSVDDGDLVSGELVSDDVTREYVWSAAFALNLGRYSDERAWDLADVTAASYDSQRIERERR